MLRTTSIENMTIKELHKKMTTLLDFHGYNILENKTTESDLVLDCVKDLSDSIRFSWVLFLSLFFLSGILLTTILGEANTNPFDIASIIAGVYIARYLYLKFYKYKKVKITVRGSKDDNTNNINLNIKTNVDSDKIASDISTIITSLI